MAGKILNLTSNSDSDGPLETAQIERRGTQFVVHYSKGESSMSKEFPTLKDAIDSPPFQKRWVNLNIETTLKLHEIYERVLNVWGEWNPPTNCEEVTYMLPNKQAEPENSLPDGIVTINNKQYHRAADPRNNPTKECYGVQPDNNTEDEVSQLLKYLFICEKNTKEYQRVKKEIELNLSKQGYITYKGDSRDLGGLNSTGMSVVYKVPHDKRGNLSKFRGRQIRVCCIGSGDHATREYMAGPLKKPSLDPKINPKNPKKGFLAPIKLIGSVPTKLQLLLQNRDIPGLKEFFKDIKLPTESIDALEKSGSITQIAAEGNIELLKILKNAGISIANKKSVCQIKTPHSTSEEGYWHSLLWAVHENCPSKTKDLIALYSSKEFKALMQDEFINTSLSNIKSIILTERQRRVRKEIESLSKDETLTLE